MNKWHSYLVIELPKHTEEEIKDFKVCLKELLRTYYNYNPEKPIIIKKISYTTSQN